VYLGVFVSQVLIYLNVFSIARKLA